MKPRIIKGNIHKDNRGTVAFVNEFDFEDIVRFYVVENSPELDTRAWQGHKLDRKHFYCVQGQFQVSYVKVNDWENPSPEIEPETVVLNANESQILSIPAGYANAVKSLQPNSKLISFSTLPLDLVKDDDVRYEKDKWQIP